MFFSDCDIVLTLKADKCQFNMTYVEFMRHLLSSNGIGIAKMKVNATLNAHRKRTVQETRSFLGLVNFSVHFISNLAITA